ncbi:MAG TPA: L-threonylcarbamoyladenylate synthase [Methanolinea sp.]|nr:L-threonylcarbamoyladenylate synthase [Methanolinea sp.]HQK55348.1 L-threonylcarbamoyladenylate synthase [Methanolinea sp.]
MDMVERAVRILRHDGLVVYPTDTIYGLGADALSEEAILKVYEAKRRPVSQPISIAVSEFEMAFGVARIDRRALAFMEAFLPGPVTVVVPARSSLPEILTGGTGMIGIRLPAHPVSLRLIKLLDSPVTATSANQHGARDPVSPDECHVMHDLLIDGGRLPGTPSTVVDLENGAILRRGALAEDVEAYITEMW